jgi:hypothetical protein
MTLAQDLNILLEDTHQDTHKLLLKHGWEFSSAKKTAPLVSTHIYRHNQHPNHEIHVTNLSGSAIHSEKSKNSDGYHQEIKTVVPFTRVERYLNDFHKSHEKENEKEN